ncbi:MAG: winged helix-turn-helix domain-containing protein [Pirellulaceae bacterium]
MTGVKKPAGLRRDPVPRTKVWLEIDGHYVFGRGVSDILKAVAETGSIKAAAKNLGKSYRHVWSKIKETEQAIGAVLVTTQVGGNDPRRSELTQLGLDLMRDFDALRQQVFSLVEREFERRLRATLDRHRRE